MASVTKRRWTKPDGSTGEGWQVRYSDPSTGKRPGKMFQLKKDADAFCRKVEREIEDGLHTADRDSKIISTVADEFISHYQHRCQAGTVGRGRVVSIEQFCRCHIVPAVGHVKASHLSFADIERLRSTLVSKGLAPVSVKHVMGVMRQIEDFARRRSYTKRAVVREVMREAPAGRARQIAVPSPAEMRRIVETALTHAPGHTARSDAFVAIMVVAASVCGLRYGELVGLRLVDVDVVSRILHVRQAVSRLGEIKSPKSSAGVRDVPMPIQLAGMIEEWITLYYVANAEQLLLSSSNGRSVMGSSFGKTYWQPLLKRAGFSAAQGSAFRFHSLRHFAASMLIQHNLPLTDVASIMGHAKFDMTLQVYAHPMVGGSRRADVIERINLTHSAVISDAGVTHNLLTY